MNNFQIQNFIGLSKGKQAKHLMSAFALFVLFSAMPVNAHHPWDGQIENFNFLQGLLSGLAHPTPILGLDHFLFLFSIGLVGRKSRLRWIPVLVAIGLVGSISSQVLPIIPGSELLIGLSLVASAFVAFKKLPVFMISPFIFLHGFVLGKAMIGIEPTPLSGYLLGLLITETLTITFGAILFQRFWRQKKIFCAVFSSAGLIFASSHIF